jgi:exosortase/archaeosortase family protein
MMLVLAVLSVLTFASPVFAQSWSVEYSRVGDVSFITPVFPPGTYELVNAPNSIPVYLRQDTMWNFIGMYGGPAAGYPQASLPESFPQISFNGYDVAVVRPVGGFTVGTPEFAILRRLTRHVGGVRFNAAVTPPLQYVTAWGATGVLKALQKPVALRGLFIDWSPFAFEIEPWCAGTNTLKLMLAIGLGLAVYLRPGWTRGLALVGLAGLIAIEANILRVAATALLYEQMGREAWGWKEWIGGATTAMAVLQVVGPAWAVRKWSRI